MSFLIGFQVLFVKDGFRRAFLNTSVAFDAL